MSISPATHLKGGILGLVGPNCWDRQDELLRAQIEILAWDCLGNFVQRMSVDSANEIGCDLHWGLWERSDLALHVVRRQVIRKLLRSVEQKLDSDNVVIESIDGTAPAEVLTQMATVRIVDQCRDLRLGFTFSACRETMSI